MDRRPLILALLFALAPSIVACGTSPAPQPRASATGASGIYGITAIVRTIPSTDSMPPSPLPGGFGMSKKLPVGGVHLVIRSATGKVAARIVSDKRGIFRVALPAGSYVVWGTGDTRLKTAVTVQPGGYTRAIVRPYWTY